MAKKLAHISEDHSREQTVYEHLTGTAELAKQFAAAFGAEEDGYLLGLLHDIGKYSDAFQRRLDGGVRVDHSTAGAKEACAHGVGYLALAIAGHHGGIPNFGSRADTKNDATLSGRLKRDLEPYDDWKTEVTLPPVKPFNMREFDTGFRLSFYIRMLFSCLVDADFIDTETFMDGALALRQHRRTGCLYAYLADGWRKNDRCYGICADRCRAKLHEPRHLRRAVHVHHRPKRRYV